MVAARLRRYCLGVCHVRAGEDSLEFCRSEASTRPSRRGNRLITADGCGRVCITVIDGGCVVCCAATALGGFETRTACDCFARPQCGEAASFRPRAIDHSIHRQRSVQQANRASA